MWYAHTVQTNGIQCRWFGVVVILFVCALGDCREAKRKRPDRTAFDASVCSTGCSLALAFKCDQRPTVPKTYFSRMPQYNQKKRENSCKIRPVITNQTLGSIGNKCICGILLWGPSPGQFTGMTIPAEQKTICKCVTKAPASPGCGQTK